MFSNTMISLFKQTFILLMLMLVFGLWAIYYGQDHTWDARDYHFYNGFAFMQQRFDWDFAASMVQAYFNPFFDSVNYLLITTQSARMVGFFHGVLTGVTVFIIFQMAKLLFADVEKNRQPVSYTHLTLPTILRV